MKDLLVIAAAMMAWIAAPSASAALPPHPNQVITVSVASSTSTTGVLEAWQRRGNDFTRVRGPVPVHVGEDGIGLASERRARTPRGVFALTQAFGRAATPGTEMPYTRVGLSHWWVSDVRSPHYNQMRVCSPGASCGFRQSRAEQLGDIDAYRHAIVIDYNLDPIVPGRGSAFFLHVTEGKPTQGCVSMRAPDLTWLLRWLDPEQSPIVSINVGDSAYSALD